MALTRFPRLSVAVIFVAVFMLSGCRDKLVHERFSQIRQNHSTQSEVIELIGDPDDRLGDQWIYQRPDEHLIVLIDFDESGSVSRKQWIDANEAVWEDTDPSPADQTTRESTTIDRRR